VLTPIALYYRVDEDGSTPAHVKLSVYVGPVDGTKAFTGTLTLQREEFARLFRPSARLMPISVESSPDVGSGGPVSPNLPPVAAYTQAMGGHHQ